MSVMVNKGRFGNSSYGQCCNRHYGSAAGALVRNRDYGIGGNAGAGEGIPIGSFGNNANYMALNGWYGGAGVNAVNHFDNFSPLYDVPLRRRLYRANPNYCWRPYGRSRGSGATVSNQELGHHGMRFTALVTQRKPATVRLRQHLLLLVL